MGPAGLPATIAHAARGARATVRTCLELEAHVERAVLATIDERGVATVPVRSPILEVLAQAGWRAAG